MGLLQDGQWVDKWYDTKATNGKFQRTAPQFRNWITLDGDSGPTGESGFMAEADRYHLYISYACPWAHRTLIFRMLKGLENIVSLSVVNSYMGEQGWTFEPADGVIPDMINNATKLYQVYTRAEKNYSGRVTVPVLWDRKKNTIVSNESSEIIRMFNNVFDGLGATPNDFYPVALREEIDDLNHRIYRNVNNGVYKAGFATSQKAYDGAVASLFETLDWLEKRLRKQRYLTGRTLTEADWRLFTTLIRFDQVYLGHFKCNLKRLVDYPNLFSYVRDLYQYPGIAATVRMDHIKNHYYMSHTAINPTGIVPTGPEIDFSIPHDRHLIK